jgi:hypothetical protein
MHAHMQLTWGHHLDTPRGGLRWLAQPGGCDRTQVEPPHDRLPHGGSLMGLGHVYVGFAP